jgi:diaminopimelate epimerase
MKIKFTKMHGLGNDFVIIDDRTAKLRKIPGIAKKLCDRRFGIGADQVLLLRRSRKADFKMLILNADGSAVEMCGNGIRCLAKYIWDNKLAPSNSKNKKASDTLAIETLAGIIHPEKSGSLVRVDMGEPLLDGKDIPVRIKGEVLGHPLKIKNRTYKMTCVSMGNPHAVIVTRNVDSFPLQQYGPAIENHRLFPNRTNVEFIEIVNRHYIKMRVWERGAGETMACGTGASAVGVASFLLGLTGRNVTVHLPGGKLKITWSGKDNHVYMTGPAVTVYEGMIEI